MNVVVEANKIRKASSDELATFHKSLQELGVSWSEPEIVVESPQQSKFTAELRVLFYNRENIVDVFEFHICREGSMVVSESEVRSWMRENLPALIKDLGSVKNLSQK